MPPRRRDAELDFDWILPGQLAQGAEPRPPALPYAHGFDVIVFCAMEIQPKLQPPNGKTVLYVPMDDSEYHPITVEDQRKLAEVSKSLAKHIRAGRRVLTTCAQGRNRSGLISALTMIRLGHAPDEAIRTVRSRRRAPTGQALSNMLFERFLRLQQ